MQLDLGRASGSVRGGLCCLLDQTKVLRVQTHPIQCLDSLESLEAVSKDLHRKVSNSNQNQRKVGRKQEILAEWDLCLNPGRALVAVSTFHRVRAISFTAYPVPSWTSMGADDRKQRKVGRQQEMLAEWDLYRVLGG